MSQENVEIVRRIYEGWSRGDFTAGADAFDPKIEFALSFGVDEATGRGADELSRAFADYLRNWIGWHTSEIDALIESGDHVVAVHRLWARGRNSRVEVEIPEAACAFTFRDGKIVGIFPTESRAKAMAAVGLSD